MLHVIASRKILPTLVELAKAADSRAALVEGGVVADLNALLKSLSSAAQCSSGLESVEELSATLGALSAVCSQEGIAKHQALEAVPSITACISLEGPSNEPVVVNALKAMANLTQVLPPQPLSPSPSPSHLLPLHAAAVGKEAE